MRKPPSSRWTGGRAWPEHSSNAATTDSAGNALYISACVKLQPAAPNRVKSICAWAWFQPRCPDAGRRHGCPTFDGEADGVRNPIGVRRGEGLSTAF